MAKLKPMVRLSKDQIEQKQMFIDNYISSRNAASGSACDANANVVKKTVSTLGSELMKDFNIQLNRKTVYDYIEKHFDTATADEYVEMLESHLLYKNDETSICPGVPYCVAISMYPFLEHGMITLGGESKAPKHLESFCGSFINLIFAVSSQFAGACLYKDQTIEVMNTNKEIHSVKMKKFVDTNNPNIKFNNFQGNWYFADISDQDICVYESGKYVKVNKVFRREYKDKIYIISTDDGKKIMCSKDHIFAYLPNEKKEESKACMTVSEFSSLDECKAKDLQIGGYLINTRPYEASCYSRIVEISTFDNDDEYVYEIETESHWYSAGGVLTHNCAAPEFLLYLHYFAQKDYGENYLTEKESIIKSKLQHVIYSINQPAAARGGQAVFFNVSLFDRYFYESMFGNFVFPDGTHVDYDSFNKLQKYFMKWLNEERARSLLTFPVLTEASLNDGDAPKDEEWADFCADMRSRGLSFFSYNDDNPAALASCCRLRSELDENDFSYSLGAGGISTGSTSVMTINLSRLFQKGYDLKEIIKKVHKFQFAHRKIVEDYIAAGLLPVYDAGYIGLDKQFCTLGVNGLNEAAEYLGYEVSNNDEYKGWVAGVLQTFKNLNTEARKIYGIKYNTELVPGESLGVKNASWDAKDSLYTGGRNCYNSYIYLPESDNTSIPDKFQMHGGIIAESLDGGSALHLNISRLPDKKFFLWLRMLAAKYGCTYWTTNVMTSMCSECGHNCMDTVEVCPVCGSDKIEYATRIIGYCKKIGNFSEGRQKEHQTRFYH